MLKKIAAGMAIIGILSASVVGCSGPDPIQANNPDHTTQVPHQEEARQIAEEFVKNDPTYLFDGIEETLELTHTTAYSEKTISEDGNSPLEMGWTFTYEFDSRHAGYGDRSGMMLAQVITHHVVVITVENGTITEAVMDGTLDLLQEDEEPATPNEEEARQTAENFVKNSPTFTFDGMPETLTLVETLYPDIEGAYQFVFSFESRHGGYGDRTGQMVLQAITPHEVSVVVENGIVKNALMDGVWDMLEQTTIG